MRGSPLFRSIFIALALVASGFGFMRLTATNRDIPSVSPSLVITTPPPADSLAVPYRLLLSADAVEINLLPGNLDTASGTLHLDPANPHLILAIRWETPPPPGRHHFAKLILEPAGRPTITHTFDAPGDIDDLFELPLRSAP